MTTNALADCYYIYRPTCEDMESVIGIPNTTCVDFPCDEGMEWECPSGTFSTFYHPVSQVDYPLTPPPGECGKDDYTNDWNYETDCIMMTECKLCSPYNKCRSDFSTSVLTFPFPKVVLTGNECGDCQP